MTRAMAGGLVYFAVIQMIAVLLGFVRIVAIDPQFAAMAALLIQLPVMFGVAWLTCGWIVKNLAIPPRTADRLLMGGLAFLLLITMTIGYSLFVVQASLSEHLDAYLSAGPAMVLAAQFLIAAFPLLQLRRSKRSGNGAGDASSLRLAGGGGQ